MIAQHLTLRHIEDPIFDSLRRWSKNTILTEPIPVAVTIALMDAAVTRITSAVER
jgi:hypothetical protein